MTDADDIVKRLRAWSSNTGIWQASYICDEAADEIDRLVAELAAERERCARICEKWHATWEREGTPHPDFIASVIAAEIRNVGHE